MTDPKPPDNLFDASVSPNNELTVDGAPVDEDIDTCITYRGTEIEKLLDVIKNSSSPSNGDKESIQRLMDLVAEERKNGLDSLADARKVSLGLEGRLRRQKETTATATSSGIDRLKAVKVLSDDRAIGYTKCIDSWKLQHSTLKKRAAADKLIASTKWGARETVLKDQLKTATLDQKDCRKEAKSVSNQLRKRDQDLAKTSALLVTLTRKLSEVHCTLTEVIRERESFKRLNKTLESEATRLPARVDGQAEKKRAHSKEMSLLAVQKQQLALETQRERKEAAKEKVMHANKEKKSLIRYTAQVRGEEKAKDLASKDQLRKEKLDKASSRLTIAASTMNHQNYALRGGTFPPPTPTQTYHKSVDGVSIRACPFLCKNVNSNRLHLFYYYRTVTH
jgi:hypothetical protein